MITPSKTSRRPLKFKTPAELGAELDRLRTGEYQKLGAWNLPQACRHLAMTIEGNLTPADSDLPTPEEQAMKEKFFGMVMGPDGMPEKLPIVNAALIPTDDCTDAEVDRLKQAFQSLASVPHKCIKVGRCGPVPLSELTALHLVHAAHHLSFLDPADAGPPLEKPDGYRTLHFADVPSAIAEIDRLSHGNFVQLGNWSLAQMARHLVAALRLPFEAPVDINPTPQEANLQAKVLDEVIRTGKPPAGVTPPKEWMPRTDSSQADIVALKDALQQLADFPHSHIQRTFFGPVPIEKYRKAILMHVAHHLGFLIPETRSDKRQF